MRTETKTVSVANGKYKWISNTVKLSDIDVRESIDIETDLVSTDVSAHRIETIETKEYTIMDEGKAWNYQDIILTNDEGHKITITAFLK